jgi:fatty-acyl-CoA synthase
MKGLMQERPLNIPMIVRHAERLHPRKTVVSKTADGVRVATFAELLTRARRLITALRGLGVGPDDRVATFSWNHQQHMEAYVGVPCMGAILHTLNIRLFAEDLAYIVDHAQDKVVIVDKSLWPAWQKVAAKVGCIRHTIVIDEAPGPPPEGTLDYETLLAGAEPGELVDVPEERAAAMCYTSGTTGHPKGVVYSHRSNVLHSMALCMADAFGVRESDVVMAIVPMFHANAWGLPYAAFMAGTDIVMPGRFLMPDVLTSLLIERGVTFAAGVPTIWQAMLEPMKQARDRLGRLRYIICGGSAVPPALQKAFHRDVGIRITHAWGMTETSPMGSVCRAIASQEGLGGDDTDALLATQGRPVFGIELRIVGGDGTELPWDGKAVGEIEVRGNWIAAAYYRDPSDDRFHDGWLRTGDVAAVDPNGYIRIADRTKDLIKSGGEWISSVALEGMIMGHPDVAEAAVIAVPHPRWCERPLACVVARPDAKDRLTRESVLEHLRPKVAKWWLPDDVVFIDQVPKTSVGKFDKKVLRERFRDHALPDVAAPQAG